MTWIYKLAIRFPRLAILTGVVGTCACAPGLLKLRLRTDGNALVPQDAPAIAVDREVRRHFGVDDQVVLAVETDHPEGIFNFHTLGVVRDLTHTLPEIEGIEREDLASLATEKQDRVYTGSLRFRPFLDPFPTTQKELDQLRETVKALDLYIGTLVSFDFRSTAILVAVSSDMDRSRLVRDLYATIDELGDIPERVSVVGAPVAESLLGVHILEDLGVLDIVGALKELLESRLGWRILPQMHELELTGRGKGPVEKLLHALVRPLPVALAAIAIILLLVCRSFWGMLLPLAEVGACLVATFGLMGYYDVPFYLTMAVLPVILTAIGIADEIHIFARYRQELGRADPGPHPQPLRTTMDEMWRPVFKTSITSCIGFLSFALSPLEPVKMFGIFTAVGIFFCMLWSLTVIPASLTLLKPKRFGPRKPSAETRHTGSQFGPLWRVAGGVMRARWPVLLLAAALVALTPIGVQQLYVQDSWIDGFSESSEFYQATQRVNEGYHGTHLLLLSVSGGPTRVEIMPRMNLRPYSAFLPGRRTPAELKRLTTCSFRPDADSPRSYRIVKAVAHGDNTRVETAREEGPMVQAGPKPRGESIRYAIDANENRMHDPVLVNKIGELEDLLETQATVGGVLGLHDHLCIMNYILRKRNPEFRIIPERPTQLTSLIKYYRMVRGEQRLREILGADHQEALITVFLKNANFQDTARLMKAVREFQDTELEPMEMDIRYAGDVAVSQTMIPAIVQTQVTSLLLSLGGILLMASLLFASLTAGLFCVLPPALAVLLNYAIMGAFDIPLGVATSMFCGMTLGIGVDYAIHLIERCRVSFTTRGRVRDGIRDAVSFAGPAIIIDAVAIAVGFGVLTLSQVPANSRLGILLVISICSCLSATLLVLPALLSLWQPWFLRRALRVAKTIPDGLVENEPEPDGGTQAPR